MNTAPLSSRLARIALLAFLAVAPATSVGCIAATDETDDAALEGGESAYIDEETDTREEGVSGGTVSQAAASSCSTTSVKGLSKQIIAEARCINPDSYVLIPDLGNVSFGSAVFRYLEKPARDKLVAALKANPSRQMTVNSALRTVAQQFLLYRWYQTGRCGIGLAAKPGNSNHETGLALDISQYSAWKSSLQNRGFHGLGSSAPVHFAILPDDGAAILPDDMVDFGYPGDFEIPEVTLEESITEVEALESTDAELLEEHPIDHEDEVCGDHAH